MDPRFIGIPCKALGSPSTWSPPNMQGALKKSPLDTGRKKSNDFLLVSSPHRAINYTKNTEKAVPVRQGWMQGKKGATRGGHSEIQMALSLRLHWHLVQLSISTGEMKFKKLKDFPTVAENHIRNPSFRRNQSKDVPNGVPPCFQAKVTETRGPRGVCWPRLFTTGRPRMMMVAVQR